MERGLSMVDGELPLVDASEGPLPQTRFVLRKAPETKLPVVLVINKVDRPDTRIAEVVDEPYEPYEPYELFLDLDADEGQIYFPIVYASAKAGRASLERPTDGGMPDASDLAALFRTIRSAVPPPTYDEAAPLQAHATNLDASPYLGRLALCSVRNGTQHVEWWPPGRRLFPGTGCWKVTVLQRAAGRRGLAAGGEGIPAVHLVPTAAALRHGQ